ncbi:hypothetical protein DMC30DRAFT_401577 [Rhodotorula diobovata]|uniref:Uncharacterized protein n=1 Tax=Rhodotorula diobovata TaxID=5288 RepID=A0A5C5FSS1_9BASI|nr:hypothetical protein DMC30DRAFT_401577 [Rhodotorula diobovata]
MVAPPHGDDFTLFEEERPLSPAELLEHADAWEIQLKWHWYTLTRNPQLAPACELTACSVELEYIAQSRSQNVALAERARNLREMKRGILQSGGSAALAARENLSDAASLLNGLRSLARSAGLSQVLMRLFAGFLPDGRTLSCKAERAAINHEPGSQDQRAALALHGLLVAAQRRAEEVDAQGRRYLKAYAAAHCQIVLRRLDPRHPLLTYTDPTATPVPPPVKTSRAARGLGPAKRRTLSDARPQSPAARPTPLRRVCYVDGRSDDVPVKARSLGRAAVSREGHFRRAMLYFGRAY